MAFDFLMIPAAWLGVFWLQFDLSRFPRAP